MGEIHTQGQAEGRLHLRSAHRSYLGLVSKTIALLLLCAPALLADVPGLSGVPLPKDVDTAIAGTVQFESKLTEGITMLVQQVEPQIMQLGWTLLGIFGCIALLNTILQSTLRNLASFHHPPLATIVACIAICFRIVIATLMMQFYVIPIFGAISFHRLFPFIAQTLSKAITTDTFVTVLGDFNAISSYLPTPGMFQVLPALVAIGLILTIALAQICMTVITAESFVVVGVLTLVGPLMIPFYVLPGQDQRFWKWIDNMLAFSMYQFIGSCFIFIFCNVYIDFFANLPGYSVMQWLVSIGYLLLITVVFAFAMFSVPTITHMIFGGMAGSASSFANALQGLVVKGVTALL